MTKKRVLVFAEYIGENHNSTAYYWSQIVKYLLGGYEVILVAPENSHSVEFVEKYGIAARLVKHAKHNKNSLLSRLWGQLRQSARFMAAIRQELKQCDLVFSGTNPIVAMGLMSIVAKLNKCQWLVLVHDVFPNNLVPARIIRPGGMAYRVLARFSRSLYSTPTHLISIGRDMKALLAEKTGKPEHITYIPNWASAEVIQPVRKADNSVLRKLGWTASDTVVFQFFGNLGRLQGIQNLLDAIDMTQSERARFLFIGDGSEQAKVIAAAEKINAQWGYQRVCYYGTIPLSENSAGLNACDVSLVTLSSQMYGLGVPSKAYFSIAADKPILCVGDEGSELHQMVKEFPVGWFVDADKAYALASQIDRIADSPQSELTSVSPRVILNQYFSEQQALEQIERVVRQLV
uniref:glycosyltransferase family 4 protein n=1 Tax=Thaumasiovibrio occultus TaxID=1891184 RepID=UPI000B357D2C|nr:glycosyltransferase family 4 protein [Thaumasiovibrio occultus]